MFLRSCVNKDNSNQKTKKSVSIAESVKIYVVPHSVSLPPEGLPEIHKIDKSNSLPIKNVLSNIKEVKLPKPIKNNKTSKHYIRKSKEIIFVGVSK
jgi:hypothetical protein